ncbi:MAG: hypothetical protein J1F01_10230, partial [Oscillospiraceae bacterium]|nr:hypothetical protein [Oscillospiraceae bacterium]
MSYNKKRLISLILSVAMIFTVFSGFTITASAAYHIIDSANDVITDTNVTVTDSDGNTIKPGEDNEVGRDDMFSFRIDFSIINNDTSGETVEPGDVLVYVFPEGIDLPSEVPGGYITNSGNEIIGNYEYGVYEGRNVVFLHFNDDFLNSGNRTGYFECQFKLNKDKIKDGDDGSFQFPGGGEYTFTYDNEMENFYKYKSAVNSDGTIEYRIVFKPDANYKNFKIEDILGSNLSFVPGSFKLGDTDVSSKVTINGQKATINLGGMVEYPNEYTLTYRVKVKDISETNGLGNTADWIVNGDNGGSANTELGNYGRFSKGASYNKGDKSVTWTLDINNSDIRGNLNKATVKDTLPEGVTVKKVYVRNNDTGAITELDLSKVLKGNTFTYTFPNIDDYGRYSIVIETETDELKAYTNESTLKWKDGYIEGDDETIDNTEGEVPKSYIEKSFASGNESTGVARWKITLDALNLAGHSGVYVFDEHAEGYDSEWSAFYNWEYIPGTFNVVYRPANGNEVILKEGTDYTVEVKNNYKQSHYGNYYSYWSCFTLNFIGAYATMPADMSGTIDIRYNTKITGKFSSSSLATIYENTATVNDVNGKLDEDTAKWAVPAGVISKKALTVAWDNDYKAYVVEWQIDFNRIYTNDYDWTGSHDYGGVSIEIRDMYDIPGALSYIPGSAKLWGGKNEWGNPDYELSITPNILTENGLETGFSYTIPKVQDKGYRIKYKTKVDQSALGDISSSVAKVGNTISAYEDGDSIGDDGAEAEIEKKYIDKSSKGVGDAGFWGNVDGYYGVNYTVEINAPAADLNPDGDTLEMRDTLSKNVNFGRKVTVSEFSSDGKHKPLDSSQYRVSYNSATRELKIVVPDKMHLIVEYYVGINAAVGENVSITNKAALFAGSYSHSSTDESTYHVASSSAGGDASGTKLRLTKIDEDDTNKTLEGVVFVLAEVDVDASTKKNIVLNEIQEYTTQSDGTAEITGLTDDRLYCYYEKSTIDGYQLDDTKYYITFEGNSASTNQADWAKKFGNDFMSNVTLADSGITRSEVISNAAILNWTPRPSISPTATPTVKPTATPTVKPTATPTVKPTATPTVKPTATATVKPNTDPTSSPSATPTATATVKPNTDPTSSPSATPTATATTKPNTDPSASPSATPTATATTKPNTDPSASPSATPTATATTKPNTDPTSSPSATPTATATTKPDTNPTSSPSSSPTATPVPSTPRPTLRPWRPFATSEPELAPTPTPTSTPTATPVSTPSPTSTVTPSLQPTVAPTPAVTPNVTASPSPTPKRGRPVYQTPKPVTSGAPAASGSPAPGVTNAPGATNA